MPAPRPPTIVAREPLPSGVSHSIASSVVFFGPKRQALAGPGDRQILVAGAIGDGVGRGAVDRVDPDQRGVALGAPRRAHGPADAVARDELAAAHLGGRDVDVVVRGLRRVDPQEGRAVAQDLDDSLGAFPAALVLLLRRRLPRREPELEPDADRERALATADSRPPRPRPRRELEDPPRPLKARSSSSESARSSSSAFAAGLGGVIGVLPAAASADPRRAAFAGPRRRGSSASSPSPSASGSEASVVRLAEDRVDQVGLAQAPEPLESQLVGYRVKVGKRARLQLGAFEYSHQLFLLSWW